MAELIHKSAAIDICEVCREAGDGDLRTVIYRISKLPAVDAVEVVRCRDCEHWDGFCYCNCHAADGNGSPIFMRYYDFCSYGKRREENE